MKFGLLGCALALGAALLPMSALADDPHDPTMRSAAARARDRAIIKRMNRQQLAYVRQRDARRLHAYRETQRGYDDNYADARAEYEQKMRAWRRAVAACNGGQWEYCDR